LTDLLTVDALEGLQTALGAPRGHVLDGIGSGPTPPGDARRQSLRLPL